MPFAGTLWKFQIDAPWNPFQRYFIQLFDDYSQGPPRQKLTCGLAQFPSNINMCNGSPFKKPVAPISITRKLKVGTQKSRFGHPRNPICLITESLLLPTPAKGTTITCCKYMENHYGHPRKPFANTPKSWCAYTPSPPKHNADISGKMILFEDPLRIFKSVLRVLQKGLKTDKKRFTGYNDGRASKKASGH